MNDFDNILTPTYQISSRSKLIKIMSATPMSVVAYARSVDISVQSLLRFLRGGTASYKVIMKIDRYIQDDLEMRCS